MSVERGGLIRRAIMSGWQRSAWICSEFAKAKTRLRFGRAVRFGRGVLVLTGVRFEIFDGGTIEIGDDTLVGPYAIVSARGGNIRIGAGSLVNFGCMIAAHASIEIGEDALIAEHVTIRDHDHTHGDPAVPYRLQGSIDTPITIGSNVWLGAKVTVTRGASICSNTIVGANSVVTRPLETPGKYAGAPARLLGEPKAQV